MGLAEKMSVARLADAARSPGDPRLLRAGPGSMGAADRLARGLGWFSIGLGLAEILAPRRFTRALGTPGREGLVRLFGAREVAAGVMTLSVDKGAGLWSRVAGDALDLAALAAARGGRNRRRGNADVAFLLVAGVTLLDLLALQGVTARHRRGPEPSRDLYRGRSGFPQGVEQARGAARQLASRPGLRAAPASLA